MSWRKSKLIGFVACIPFRPVCVFPVFNRISMADLLHSAPGLEKPVWIRRVVEDVRRRLFVSPVHSWSNSYRHFQTKLTIPTLSVNSSTASARCYPLVTQSRFHSADSDRQRRQRSAACHPPFMVPCSRRDEHPTEGILRTLD